MQHADCTNHPRQPTLLSRTNPMHPTISDIIAKNSAANLTQTWRCKVLFEKSR